MNALRASKHAEAAQKAASEAIQALVDATGEAELPEVQAHFEDALMSMHLAVGRITVGRVALARRLPDGQAESMEAPSTVPAEAPPEWEDPGKPERRG